jgi:hypothetical protein
LLTDHPIRAAAGRVRVDRGRALYLSDSPKEGFLHDLRGEAFALTPGRALIDIFAAWAKPAALNDPLTRALSRLSGPEEDQDLLIDGIKLMELGAAEGALSAYEKRVRQRAARRLREKRGGGLLWLCAACLHIARKGLTQQ